MVYLTQSFVCRYLADIFSNSEMDLLFQGPKETLLVTDDRNKACSSQAKIGSSEYVPNLQNLCSFLEYKADFSIALVMILIIIIIK